jgi:hypothetical protein
MNWDTSESGVSGDGLICSARFFPLVLNLMKIKTPIIEITPTTAKIPYRIVKSFLVPEVIAGAGVSVMANDAFAWLIGREPVVKIVVGMVVGKGD